MCFALSSVRLDARYKNERKYEKSINTNSEQPCYDEMRAERSTWFIVRLLFNWVRVWMSNALGTKYYRYGSTLPFEIVNVSRYFVINRICNFFFLIMLDNFDKGSRHPWSLLHHDNVYQISHHGHIFFLILFFSSDECECMRLSFIYTYRKIALSHSHEIEKIIYAVQFHFELTIFGTDFSAISECSLDLRLLLSIAPKHRLNR